ncbi:cytochrome P450 [Aspergillus undulatus]|uniref:cytochrome P450 n=1 Tax=Aspergillus undulatus TaxID=1810928 RepID=UPI003CCD2898
MIAQSRRRRLLLILLVLSAFIGFLYINAGYVSSKTWRPKSDFTTIPSYRRVTKVSMLYGAKNSLYERALQSHRRHAERWGYGMDVLQEDIAVGYWNKPAYLLALVVAELARPDGERVEWLMWVDADSVIINPAIPLEIFLPPSNVENVHLVATKDHKGLNTGIFFLRVHQWTVNMLVEALAYPVYKPDIDLGMQVDQTAMERILNQTTYKANVTCLPRTWINTYEWTHAYEGTKGNLLVHFPGLGEQRWEHMEKWLDTVERTPEEWEVRVSETWYLQQTEEFWDRIHKANKIISSHEKRQVGEKGPSPIPSSSDRDLDRAVNELKKVLYEEPYEGELLDQRIKDCNPSFVVGNLPTFLLVFGLIYILTAAYRIRKNPLSTLPGPEITKWTDLILKYYAVLGQRPRYVHALHERYGPIVRISPTTVDISSIPAAREIHRIASPFLKSPWYRLLNRKDGESIFSTTDPEYHRRHRRLLSSPLSDTNLRSVEPLVASRISLTISRIREEAVSPRRAADIYKWFFFMATDIIGELSFGDSFRMLEIGTKNQYISDLETVAKIGGIRATFPVTMRLAGILPLSIFKEVVASTDRILSYATQSVDRYKRHLALNPDDPKPTLFTKLYDASQVKEGDSDGECLSDREIRNDAQSFIVAGSDTTANTLTYLVWSVLKNRKIQERLVAELAALTKTLSIEEGLDKKDALSDTSLRDLPYMNQVINEALRLYPAVPSGLPRTVPDKGSTLAGYWIPGGATVSTQLYSLHRDPEVFAEPERFDPSRWMDRLRRIAPRKDGITPRDGVLLPLVPDSETLHARGNV